MTSSNTLTPLSLYLHQSSDRPVAFNHDGILSRRAFVESVQGWALRFSRIKDQRWAVYHRDSAEFLAILLALWQHGKTACIPGDNRPGTVDRLKQHVDQFVGEFPSLTDELVVSSADSDVDHNKRKHPLEDARWLIPDTEFCALEVYTSGSTGEPKAIGKTLKQLEAETRVLSVFLENLPAETRILSTVSHQHFYGMTFRLFLPFSLGLAFDRGLCEYPEDIVEKAQNCNAFILTSSPSHLSRLPETLDWLNIQDKCKAVISSAAPLLRQDSLKAQTLLQTPVREIYGSSETGVIAWRIQSEHANKDALWQAVGETRIQVDESDCLRVYSPYTYSGSWYGLPDRIRRHTEHEFELLGRVDKLVKIEGKRVSLSAIERLLDSSIYIKQCRALVLNNKRVEAAIVAELSSEGKVYLKQAGKRALVVQLKACLQAHLETVTLPRRWRFPTQLPYNVQGKLPLENLTALFDKAKSSEKEDQYSDSTASDAENTKKMDIKWPEIISKNVQSNQLELVCSIPGELIYFDGHFSSAPILPGIVQVHWAEAFARRWLQIEGRFVRLEQVKFQQVISPETTVNISLKYDREKNKLSFSYDSDLGGHSSGRICFQ
jgi:acyl-coenzyme A synthetase/AMP-(fatty) acid ligase